MTFCVATMSSKIGWAVDSVEEAIALHLTYWFESRKSQGIVFSNVPSFYFLHQKYGENKTELVSRAEKELTNYFRELFPEEGAVLVAIDTKSFDGTLYTYRMIISIRVMYEGKAYDAARALYVNKETYDLLERGRLE